MRSMTCWFSNREFCPPSTIEQPIYSTLAPRRPKSTARQKEKNPNNEGSADPERVSRPPSARARIRHKRARDTTMVRRPSRGPILPTSNCNSCFFHIAETLLGVQEFQAESGRMRTSSRIEASFSFRRASSQPGRASSGPIGRKADAFDAPAAALRSEDATTLWEAVGWPCLRLRTFRWTTARPSRRSTPSDPRATASHWTGCSWHSGHTSPSGTSVPSKWRSGSARMTPGLGDTARGLPPVRLREGHVRVCHRGLHGGQHVMARFA
jgi:hypothetical protein